MIWKNPFAAGYSLRVDYLPRSALALPGRLGLTRAPGRWAPGRGADPDVRLREDLAAIARRASVLVTLLEPHEIAELGDLEGESRRAGLSWIHFPIPDMWAPDDMPAARHLVGAIVSTLEAGSNVVTHCWGGLGRAGTIAASCLVARGTPPDRALERVRAAREGAIQSEAQERFIAEFAADVGWPGGA